MRIEHSIDLARADQVGPNGVAPEALANTVQRTEPALAWLRARHAGGGLPLLRLPAKHDDLVSI
jgi:glucose-6-phosphate isomerase